MREHRPPDVQHIRQTLDLDGPIDAQVGNGAGRKGSIEFTIDRARTVHDGCVDSGYVAGHDSIAGVDLGTLADQDVFGLRLGDLQARHQHARLGNFGEHVAGFDALADFERHLLHAAANAGADGQVIHLPFLQQRSGAQFFDLHLLGLDLRLYRIFHDVELLLLHLKAAGRLLPLGDGEFDVDLGFEMGVV